MEKINCQFLSLSLTLFSRTQPRTGSKTHSLSFTQTPLTSHRSQPSSPPPSATGHSRSSPSAAGKGLTALSLSLISVFFLSLPLFALLQPPPPRVAGVSLAVTPGRSSPVSIWCCFFFKFCWVLISS